MPIREYGCDKCGFVFEKITTGMSPNEMVQLSVKCPEPRCAGRCRLLAPKTARPQFKGSGFYETDYKGK